MAHWPTTLRETPDRSALELAAAITDGGLPLEALVELAAMGFTADEVGRLVINPRTLRHRRSRREPLSSDEADRAVRLARIYGHAEEVFGDGSRAWDWLRSPNVSLEDHIPVLLLQTETGARVVEEALTRIDEGIFA